MSPDFFLFNFSNLFVLLVGFNFACVVLARPIGGSHFFFDFIDEMSKKAIKKMIDNTSLEKKKMFVPMEKQVVKMQYFIDTNQFNLESETSFTKLKNTLHRNIINENIDDLVEKCKRKIDDSTAAVHLPIICGLISLYGIFILTIAAINDVNMKSTGFLFLCNILITGFLAVCMFTEGELIEGRKHKKCCYFHPCFWQVITVIFVMFGLFMVTINSWFNLYYPICISENSMVYITILIFLLAFFGYLLWNRVCIWRIGNEYKDELKRLSVNISFFSDILKQEKYQDEIKRMLTEQKKVEIKQTDFVFTKD